MNLRSWLLVPLFLCAAVVILAGLIRTRRLDSPLFFGPYLATVAACSGLAWSLPSSFWTPEFYWWKEAVCGALRLALTVELGHRVLRAFPTAKARWQALAGPLLVTGALFCWRLAWPPTASYGTMARLHLWGTWALVILGVLVTYHNLPISDWHRAIILGLALYGGSVIALAQALELWRGLSVLNLVLAAVNGYGWTALMAYWSWAAWRAQREPVLVLREVTT